MKKHFTKKKYFQSIALALLAPWSTLEAQTGTTQQSLSELLAANQQPIAQSSEQPGKPLPAKNAALLLEAAKNENGKNLFDFFKRHPFHTFTAKSLLTPAGTHIEYGGVGIAVGGFHGSPFDSQASNQSGGGGSVILPLGDSDKLLGVALTVNEFGVNQTSPGQDRANGNFTVMLNKWITGNTMVVAGSANLIPWGNAITPMGQSYYGAITHMWGVNFNRSTHAMSGSIGLGTGTFAPMGQMTSNDIPKANQDNTVYPFANLSYNLTPALALVGDYYSETFAVGASYLNLNVLPLSFVLYVGNLRQTDLAPGLTYGLRVATSFSYL